MASCLIGVDVGTSGMKTVLVRSGGGVLAVAEHGYPMLRPHSTWAENRPDDWMAALSSTVHEVVDTSGISREDVGGICIVGQRDPLVLLDDTGTVLTPAIHWTDRRDQDETERLYDELGRKRLIRITGVVPIPALGLPNLVWTKRHLPEVWSRVRHALFPKDYLIYRLTGEIATDISSPGRTVLNDWRSNGWSEELCAQVGVDPAIFPPIRYESSGAVAELSRSAADLIGLAPGVVIASGGGDDQSATLGCGVIDVGDMSVGTGSSSCWRLVTDRESDDERGFADFSRHVVPHTNLYEMAIAGTGTSFRWFRDVFGTSTNRPYAPCSYEELIEEAAVLEPGADGLLYFPYIDGARLPYFDDAARGVFFGILPGHRRSHFLRAIMEGIAYHYPPLVQLFGEYGPEIRSMTIVDGEARSKVWNAMKADVLGRAVRTTGVLEAAAIGAAILAGMASGAYRNAADGVAALVAPGDVYEPDLERHERYEAVRQQWEAVRVRLFEAFHAGAEAPAATVTG